MMSRGLLLRGGGSGANAGPSSSGSAVEERAVPAGLLGGEGFRAGLGGPERRLDLVIADLLALEHVPAPERIAGEASA